MNITTATNDSHPPQPLAELTHQRVSELSDADLGTLRRFAQQCIHRAELELRQGALQRLEAEDLVQEVICEILTGAESPNEGYHPEPHDVGTLPQFVDWMRTLIQRRIARAGLFAAASPELPEPKEVIPATVPPAPSDKLPSEIEQSFTALRTEYADEPQVLEVLEAWEKLLKA